MSSEPRKDLFEEALSLPAKQRARLAHELLQSLDEGEDPDAAEAWLSEIERRAKEVRDGTAQVEEWAVVRKRLEARWPKR